MRPLQGITVVSIEQAVAVPFATRQLADLGARVIKIERTGTGDFARHYDTSVNGMSSHFVWCNRSKESITLDLKDQDTKQVVDRLLESADVFVQNLAPGAAERMGFGSDVLKEKYPELIIGNLSGYGETGPYKDKKAYDLLVQCEAGLVSVTGTEDVPSKAGISAADIAAGMYVYSGILTALFQRMKTGKGTVLEISMLEALGEWMGYPAYYAGNSGKEPTRTGASHSTIYPYGPFTCGDEKTVFLGLQNEREWGHFCEVVLKQPELTDDPVFKTNSLRDENRDLLKSIIEKVFAELTSSEVIERLETAKIANARLNKVQDFYRHPQLEARDRWQEVDSPVGGIRSLKPPVTMEGFTPVMKAIPALGEHTEEILREYGFEEETINKWARAGLV
ncbi:CaiB/BaiF CoA transferase family protein [Halobacillus naozhouensis]|uniref:CaiB/BaiF CoA-transferase family protein n=1 Tax=Halobacillus naozhouensis TaxID=554880 RepID=A0ABY8J2W4_9BACI|nr:CaiB/BaiF CoA-transferase family protein [Halobacillus naozhouensis]WFT76832.1 CaiB/BaiF CoA-transferase family protein [Halobacillus naozhouensis]